MKSRRRRGTRITVLLLLLFLTVASALSQTPLQFARANPGVLLVPSQYPTIQAAINAAYSGDTIQVSPATYHEKLVITKSLNLIGASPSNTIIDASASGIGLNITAASSVYVSGFTIMNTGPFDNGVRINSSTNITISGNKILTSVQTIGAYIVNSNSSTVSRNTITGNLYGVAIIRGFGILVQGNNVTGNASGDIYISRSSGNRIVNNTLRLSQDGLMLLNSTNGNIVARNLVSNNTQFGILLQDCPNAGNLIIENTIKNNQAFSYTLGLNIQNSTGNRFYHNNLSNNSGHVFGVSASDLVSNSWDNATGSPLMGDSKIKFVDTRGRGVWTFNETVIYDTNNDNMYSAGDKIIAQVNGTLRGTPPALGTPLATDSRIKFGDLYNSNAWSLGDPVVYENDTNNVFDPGEIAIVGVGGNYWGNYNGLDNGSHGFAGDGIGDTLIPTPCPNGGRPCLASGPASVDWYPLMISWKPSNLNITISAKPVGGYPPLLVSFTASTGGGVAPYTYRWNFGDGTVSPQQNTTHTYSTKGTYVTTLTVTDASSATSTNYVSVTILAPIGNLALKVIDQGMKTIQGANVTLLATPAGQPTLSALTNNLGITTFTGLAAGSYLVQASSSGYQPANKNITVVSGQTTSDQLVLTKVAGTPNNFPWLLLGSGIATAVGASALIFILFKRREKQRKLKAV